MYNNHICSLDSVQGPQFGGYGSPKLTLEVLHNDGGAIDSKEVTFGTPLKVRACVTDIGRYNVSEYVLNFFEKC